MVAPTATRAVVALTLATLFFGRQIASWSEAQNRYLYHWHRDDSLYLIAAVLLTALLIFGVDRAARRLAGPRVRAGLRLAFLSASQAISCHARTIRAAQPAAHRCE